MSMRIITDRTVIRTFMEIDAYGVLEYLSDPRANCFKDDRLGSVAEALAYMERKPKEMLRYAVCLKENDRIIGEMFALPENGDTYSVGWHFNRHFEGKGYACEAATAFFEFLFEEVDARRIYGYVEEDNTRSQRLCERLGMRLEGCFKEFISFVSNPDGTPRYEDIRIYAILRREWEQQLRIAQTPRYDEQSNYYF